MATRQFADLSSYRRAVNNAQATGNLLDTILGGIQQGVKLQQLPQTIQENAIAQQLQNAINLQKLQDLQNPQAAIARDVASRLTLEAALNPNKGLVNLESGLGTIATPGAITVAQQAALPSTVTPSTVLPTATAGIPVTEVAPFGIGTGVYSDPSIPLAAAQRASDADLNKIIAEATIKNQLDSQRVQSFSPGSMVGTAEQVRRGEGVRIPDRTAEPKPFSLSPGEKLFAPDGTVMAENPSNSTTSRPITVSPGSVVIGADGKEIFRNPASSGASAKPPTEGQAAYQLYGSRMEKASKILDDLSSFDPKEGASMLPNRLKSSTRQNVEQAERDFLNAVLRKESGATITDVEFENGRRQYFRQPGDSAATIAQKKANRDLVTAEFKRLGGTPVGEIPSVTTQQEFDALPSGSIYLEDGQQYRKP